MERLFKDTAFFQVREIDNTWIVIFLLFFNVREIMHFERLIKTEDQ